jgi:hypothetical protein
METINQKTSRFTQLLMAERPKTLDIMQRVAAHCVQVKGKKLTEFLSNGSPEEEKHAFLDALLQIIETRNFTALTGTVPEGQAKSKSPATPKPKVVKVVVVEEEDLPDPYEDDEAPVVTPTPNPAMAGLAAALAKMHTAPKPLTEADVKRIAEQYVNDKFKELMAKFRKAIGE